MNHNILIFNLSCLGFYQDEAKNQSSIKREIFSVVGTKSPKKLTKSGARLSNVIGNKKQFAIEWVPDVVG